MKAVLRGKRKKKDSRRIHRIDGGYPTVEVPPANNVLVDYMEYRNGFLPQVSY